MPPTTQDEESVRLRSSRPAPGLARTTSSERCSTDRGSSCCTVGLAGGRFGGVGPQRDRLFHRHPRRPSPPTRRRPADQEGRRDVRLLPGEPGARRRSAQRVRRRGGIRHHEGRAHLHLRADFGRDSRAGALRGARRGRLRGSGRDEAHGLQQLDELRDRRPAHDHDRGRRISPSRSPAEGRRRRECGGGPNHCARDGGAPDRAGPGRARTGGAGARRGGSVRRRRRRRSRRSAEGVSTADTTAEPREDEADTEPESRVEPVESEDASTARHTAERARSSAD